MRATLHPPVSDSAPARSNVLRAIQRGLGSAVMLAMVLGAILEYTAFRYAYLLADRSTIAIAYKGNRLEEGHSEQVIVVGPSTALAIDAHQLQNALQDHVSVYNYAVPNLGTAEQYYFILKKYLQFNRRPDVLVLALPPDSILNVSAEHEDPFIEEIERQRFRRFFGPTFLLTTVAPATRQWSFVTEAAETALPSANFRVFIKNATFAPEQDEISDWEDVGSVDSLLRRNRAIVSRLQSTNGQLVYYGDRVVSEGDVTRSLPGPPMTDLSVGRPLEDAIRLADSAGISIRLIFTPICCERAAVLQSNGSWTLLAHLLHIYEQRYPRFRMSDNALRPYEREYFGDAVHLNERGATRFNQELAARLPGLLASGDPRGHVGQ